MKTYQFAFLLFLTGFFFLACTSTDSSADGAGTNAQEDARSTTTLYLVRHGETDGPSSGNPNLSETGRQRAERLTREIGKRVDAVYSTNYLRTQQTATPTAEAYGLEVRSYDPGNMKKTVDQILRDHPNGRVLIVGHSNTTPDMLNVLTKSRQYSDISHDDYANLYEVKIKRSGKTTVRERRY